MPQKDSDLSKSFMPPETSCPRKIQVSVNRSCQHEWMNVSCAAWILLTILFMWCKNLINVAGCEVSSHRWNDFTVRRVEFTQNSKMPNFSFSQKRQTFNLSAHCTCAKMILHFWKFSVYLFFLTDFNFWHNSRLTLTEKFGYCLICFVLAHLLAFQWEVVMFSLPLCRAECLGTIWSYCTNLFMCALLRNKFKTFVRFVQTLDGDSGGYSTKLSRRSLLVFSLTVCIDFKFWTWILTCAHSTTGISHFFRRQTVRADFKTLNQTVHILNRQHKAGAFSGDKASYNKISRYRRTFKFQKKNSQSLSKPRYKRDLKNKQTDISN